MQNIIFLSFLIQVSIDGEFSENCNFSSRCVFTVRWTYYNMPYSINRTPHQFRSTYRSDAFTDNAASVEFVNRPYNVFYSVPSQTEKSTQGTTECPV